MRYFVVWNIVTDYLFISDCFSIEDNICYMNTEAGGPPRASYGSVTALEEAGRASEAAGKASEADGRT